MSALEANEQLYIERLGTLHPQGYNEDSSEHGASDKGERGARDRAASGASGDVAAADGDGPRSTATAKEGKEFLDAAMGGRIDDLSAMFVANPSILHFRGHGLGQTALHWACARP